MPGKRAVIGIGVADVILLARFAACVEPVRAGERGPLLAIATAWGVALAACAFWLARELPDARVALLAGFVVANVALAAAFLRRPRRALPALARALGRRARCGSTRSRVGGAAYLRDNPLAQKILEIDRAAGGGTTWVAFGRDDVPNLFRALGVRALNGAQPLPQLELWRRIDPDGRQRKIYDRYAHVAFVATRRRRRASGSVRRTT